MASYGHHIFNVLSALIEFKLFNLDTDDGPAITNEISTAFRDEASSSHRVNMVAGLYEKIKSINKEMDAAIEAGPPTIDEAYRAINLSVALTAAIEDVENHAWINFGVRLGDE